MNKILNMKEKYKVIYQFMVERLELEDKEALKNTLNLEGIMSDNLLNRFKCFIKYTDMMFIKNPEYVERLKSFYNEEFKVEKKE